MLKKENNASHASSSKDPNSGGPIPLGQFSHIQEFLKYVLQKSLPLLLWSSFLLIISLEKNLNHSSFRNTRYFMSFPGCWHHYTVYSYEHEKRERNLSHISLLARSRTGYIVEAEHSKISRFLSTIQGSRNPTNTNITMHNLRAHKRIIMPNKKHDGTICHAFGFLYIITWNRSTTSPCGET